MSQIPTWSWTCTMATSASPRRKPMWRNAHSTLCSMNPSSMTYRLIYCQISPLSSWSWTLTALPKTRFWDAWCSAQTAPAPLAPPTGRRSARTHDARSRSGTPSANTRASLRSLYTRSDTGTQKTWFKIRSCEKDDAFVTTFKEKVTDLQEDL